MVWGNIIRCQLEYANEMEIPHTIFKIFYERPSMKYATLIFVFLNSPPPPCCHAMLQVYKRPFLVTQIRPAPLTNWDSNQIYVSISIKETIHFRTLTHFVQNEIEYADVDVSTTIEILNEIIGYVIMHWTIRQLSQYYIILPNTMMSNE